MFIACTESAGYSFCEINPIPCALISRDGGISVLLTIQKIVFMAMVLGYSAGCSNFRHKPDGTYTTMLQTPIENAEQAKQLNTKALAEMSKGNLEKSEKLLKEALVADVNYAPAHNNLGQIYLRRRQLYLAAWEFEFANSLMPEKAEPYLNLGLVYETAGQFNTAREYYLQASEISPQDPQVVGCLARVLVKSDDDPEQTAHYLQQVVMHHENSHWSKWARELLETKYRAYGLQLDQAMQSFDNSGIPNAVEVLDPLPLTQQVLPKQNLPLPYNALQVPEQSSKDLELVPAIEELAPVITAPETILGEP